MSLKKWKGLLASGVFVGALAVVIDGCSSSSSTDGGVDAADEPSHHPRIDASPFDSGSGGGSDSGSDASVPPYDGTSGKPCASNADCKGTAADAPGTNVCSNTYSGHLNPDNGVASPQFWPTSLCMAPLPTMAGVGNCDPGPQGFVQFCDSADPNNPNSSGICLPLTSPQQAGPTSGICLPACSFALDGSRPTGCPGKDTCTPFTFLLNPGTTMVTGYGFCQGTCEVDADCSALGAGWVCQTDDGFCTKTKKARTKPLGAACTNSGNGATPIATSDRQTGTCNCPFSGSMIPAFYCTSACVVGGVPCPNGWTCDAFLPGQFVFTGAADGGGDIVVPAPSVQNPGLPGLCMAPCANPDGGGAAEAGVPDAAADAAASDASPGMDGGSSQCPGSSNVPPLSTCRPPSDMSGTVAGPDCVP